MFGSSYSGGFAMFGVVVLLIFVAFVAAIVVTVMLYKKYISAGKAVRAGGLKRDWGPFFRFESLIIEKILQALYIFSTLLIAFESAAGVLVSVFSLINDPAGSLMGIIGILLLCLLLEVLNRLGFELTMMTILIWKNTAVIRQTLTGTAGASQGFTPQPPINPAQPVQPTASAQPDQPATPSASIPPQPPVASASAASTDWTCPHCGTVNKAGSFCAQCGARKE